MTARIAHLPAHEPIAGVLAALDADGAVIVEGLLDADLLARQNAELDPLLAAARPDRQFLNPAIEWFFGKRETGDLRRRPVVRARHHWRPLVDQPPSSHARQRKGR